MKIELVAATIAAIVLSGCATVSSETRLTPGFRASEYNRLSATYMERPTFASIQQMSDGASVLRVRMSMYGGKESSLPMDMRYASQYSAALSRFSEWEALATSSGDAITKRIASVPTWGNGIQADLTFTFHSGNSQTHYVSIEFCAVGTCLEDARQVYGKRDADGLRRLIEDVGAGKAPQPNRESRYN